MTTSILSLFDVLLHSITYAYFQSELMEAQASGLLNYSFLFKLEDLFELSLKFIRRINVWNYWRFDW